MKRTHGTLILALALAVASFAPARALAMSSYYSNCTGCHGATPTTCAGCHRHRGTVTGSLPKTTFTPGESVAITVSAGARTGFWRAAVLDAQDAVVGSVKATAQGATTVTVTAPTTAGTYNWKVAWYGNKYTETPGAGWIADTGNTDHGYMTTALPAFTVESASPPPPPPPASNPVAELAPATLAIGSVTVGQTSSQTATVKNTGSADLVVNAPTPCSGSNPASMTLSPTAGFTVAAGASTTVTVSFAPTAAGAASACWSFGTNDTAHATLQLNATGTGADVAPPPPPPSTPCQACHANPPTSGEHAFHLNGVVDGCGSCHGAGYSNNTVVDTIHNNGTLDVAASTGYDKAASSCSNTCHGTKNWTGGVTPPPPPPPTQSCTTCHAIPPATGKHATHAKQACADCHGAGYSTTTVVAATHQDGKSTLGSAAGWNATTKSCSNACHGSQSWSGGSSPGTSGGSTSGGGSTGACNSCHKMPPSSGRHALHRSEHVSCAACHGSGYSTTTVNASTHKNGSVTLASKVGWNGSSRSCSNSCHGKETWGSSGSTSSGGSSSGGSSSGGSSGGATGCTGCHKIPPANGEHAKHLKKKVGCGTCHGSGYSSTTVNASTHQNGKVNLSSKIGFNASRRTCQNSCHGRESWVKSKGGGDDKEKDDFVVLQDATDGGEQKTAGGCSSAGGVMPLLGLLGVALLGLRRRRSA